MPITMFHTKSQVDYINRMLGPISQDLIEIGEIVDGWIYAGTIAEGSTGYDVTYDVFRNSLVIREVYRPNTTSVFYPWNDFRSDFPDFIEWAGQDWPLHIPTQPIVSAKYHRS